MDFGESPESSWKTLIFMVLGGLQKVNSVFLEMHFQGVWEPIGGGDHFRGSGELSGDALKTAWDGTGTNLGLGSLSGSALGLSG